MMVTAGVISPLVVNDVCNRRQKVKQVTTAENANKCHRHGIHTILIMFAAVLISFIPQQTAERPHQKYIRGRILGRSQVFTQTFRFALS